MRASSSDRDRRRGGAARHRSRSWRLLRPRRPVRSVAPSSPALRCGGGVDPGRTASCACGIDSSPARGPPARALSCRGSLRRCRAAPSSRRSCDHRGCIGYATLTARTLASRLASVASGRRDPARLARSPGARAIAQPSQGRSHASRRRALAISFVQCAQAPLHVVASGGSNREQRRMTRISPSRDVMQSISSRVEVSGQVTSRRSMAPGTSIIVPARAAQAAGGAYSRVVNRCLRSLGLFVLVGCAPAGISTSPEHPANPAAPAGRLAGPPAALQPEPPQSRPQPAPQPPPKPAPGHEHHH